MHLVPLRRLLASHDRYVAAGVDEAIAPTDDMFDPARRAHYFHCGRDAIRLIELGLLSIGVPDIRRVLDLPSGAGRVTRTSCATFPMPRLRPAICISLMEAT